MLSNALQQVFDEFARSGVRELHVRTADFELYLSNDPAASAAAADPKASRPNLARQAPPLPSAPERDAPSAPTPELPPGAIIVNAPNLGTFYRAPKPGAANYVEVGAKVSVGDELCLVEVMKLFTAVRAEAAGTVHSVLVEDGAMVEGGQPLFALVAT